MNTHDFNSLIFINMRDFFTSNLFSIGEDVSDTIRREGAGILTDRWLVQFDFKNVDDYPCHFSHTIGEMYKDWMNDCEWVPENGAFIHNVQIICASPYKHWILKDEELDFQQFIEEVKYYFYIRLIPEFN